MYKSGKKLAVLCIGILVFLEMWMILLVHCRASETDNDKKQTQTVKQDDSTQQKNQTHRQTSRRSSVSGRLRIPSIMWIQTASDEDMAMSSCRLWQAIQGGNSNMCHVTGPIVLINLKMVRLMS